MKHLEFFSMQRARSLSWALMLALLTITAFGQISETHTATRVALVGSDGNDGSGKVLDLATALLGKDTDLQLLDRAEVDRVLREQAFSLAGMVRAEDAVKAGQLLHVDLFAVLEGSLTNESQASVSMGLVVFDAKTGVRYADSALLASNAVSAASAVAAAVRAAVVKSHLTSQELHTVGLLSVRNADLPRQFDSICDSVGLLLERELTASPGIAVLERRRLEQVNKERSVAPDAEGNRLLSSLLMMQLDIGRDGDGLRGTITFVGSDEALTNKITASVPTRDSAALAHLLGDKTEQFLKAPTAGASADREAEAARFHREYGLLLAHHDYFAALHDLEAALALSPEQTGWQREMASLLPDAAMEVIDPGGVDSPRSLATQPSEENLSSCLALGQRGADMLLDLTREAVAQAKPGEPFSEMTDMYNPPDRELDRLLKKLAGVNTSDGTGIAGIAKLAETRRTRLMGIIEPYMVKATSAASFARYSQTLEFWFLVPNEMDQQDDELALSHWIEVSHKLNPPDGSGKYGPIDMYLSFQSNYGGNQLAKFCRTLEQDPDPVIRLYSHAGLVKSTMTPYGDKTDTTLAAEREFRLYTQDLLAHDKAFSSGPIRNRAWSLIQDTIDTIHNNLINDPRWGNEYLEAVRFAFAQGDIQPLLFRKAAEALDHPPHRNLSGELEVVNGALKLILENPGAYPKQYTNYYTRSEVIQDFQKRRDYLIAELSGTNAPVPPPPPAPWKQSVCLLDLAKPMNGCGWFFEPVVQDGQVYAVALGIQELGLPEDYLQLVRVPLAGGSPAFLGRAEFTEFGSDRPRTFIARRLARETNTMTSGLILVRAACVGAGCYFAATSSGIFIFPTNGGPVRHLGTINGLPSDDISALAFLDDKLYIGAGDVERGGYLVAYEPASEKFDILASSRRSEHLSPLDDQRPFYTVGIVTDSMRHRLIMALTSKRISPPTNRNDIPESMGIWSYLPATGEYHRLAPLRISSYNTWFGTADTNTVVLKQEVSAAVLFDLRNDQLISSYDTPTAKTNLVIRFWESAVPGDPNNRRPAEGPFFLCDGWFYSARPFERMALADGHREKFPPLRTDYPFQPRESLQLLADGKHILAADQISLWLLELKPEPDLSSGNGNIIKTAPAKP